MDASNGRNIEDVVCPSLAACPNNNGRCNLGTMLPEESHDQAWKFLVEDCSLRNRAAHWDCKLFREPAGVKCAVCKSTCPALPMNSPCSHAACTNCWARHVEKELPPAIFSQSLTDKDMPCVKCICCTEEMSWPLLCMIGRYSESLLCWLAACDKGIMIEEKKRHYRNIPNTTIASTFVTQCGICREVRFAAVSNSCGHVACHGCWMKWVKSQIDDVLERCALLTRVSSSGSLPCFGHRCQQSIDAPLWASFFGESDIALFDSQMTRRRKLEANRLYPSEMQVECPMPGCYGLGYLGFDSVMCFVCEHQWLPAEPGAAPCDVNVEELMGVQVKRCPKCCEFIEKNGGCDHMTCRCKYEFYWSSLKPYKR